MLLSSLQPCEHMLCTRADSHTLGARILQSRAPHYTPRFNMSVQRHVLAAMGGSIALVSVKAPGAKGMMTTLAAELVPSGLYNGACSAEALMSTCSAANVYLSWLSVLYSAKVGVYQLS